MTITIAMPQLGLTMTEATVSEWLKKPGDAVRKDEPLLSVSTDKVDMDIEATTDGILREIVVGQGQTVPVGTPLAYIDTPGDPTSPPHPVVAPSTLPPKTGSSAAAPAPAEVPGHSEDKAVASATGTRTGSMTVTIAMPQLGLTMTEATVSEWLKKPGDAVRKDEPLLSVSTDKVDMDIEATADGILREIVVGQGQTVPVGTPLAYIDTLGNPTSSPHPAVAPSTLPPKTGSSAAAPVPAEVPGHSEDKAVASAPGTRTRSLRASPRAKRRANELGIDLSSVQGSGPEGRIVEEDLLKIAAGRPASAVPQPDKKRRQTIADRMVESIRTIPSFSVSLEANAERLVSLYQSLCESIGRQAQSKLTYTDLLLRALALSLAEFPAMNVVWKEGTVHQRSQVDLGLAVATERGVVVPILSNAADLSLPQMVSRRAELAGKARQSRLTFADLEGGVGTLSNLGMYRIDRFEGLISPGQTFLLAAGKLRNRPWIEAASLVVKPTVILNLSVDHRVADGAMAAALLERIAEVIENPDRLL